MKRLCILLLAVFLSFPTVLAQEQRDYFPLEVGNWWEYNWGQWNEALEDGPEEWVLLRTEVGTTAQFADRKYLQLYHHFGWGVGDTLWVRAEGQKVWSWIPEDGKESLWLNFGQTGLGYPHLISKEVLGTIHPSDIAPWKWKIRVFESDSIFVERGWGGDFLQRVFPEKPGWIDHSMAFEFWMVPGILEFPFWSEYYVPDVGPVLMYYVWGWELTGLVILQRAYIGGEFIDVPTSVKSSSWGKIKALFQ